MIVDRQNTGWIVAILLLFAVATAAYIPYARPPGNPSGGSLLGLTYGIAGTAMILIAIALSMRKRLRTLRAGRTYRWMQAHVWLGLLSYPLILYHAGFAWGGTLTQVLMWLFTLITVSGIIGLLLQNLVPTLMFRDVPLETVYEQIPAIRKQLLAQCDELVEAAAQGQADASFAQESINSGSGDGSATAVATEAQLTTAPGQVLREFHQTRVRPFLQDDPAAAAAFTTSMAVQQAFDRLRTLLPADLHDATRDLQDAVEEARQMRQQARLHRWLHAWLFVHVPLSWAMFVLMVVHIVIALRFM